MCVFRKMPPVFFEQNGANNLITTRTKGVPKKNPEVNVLNFFTWQRIYLCTWGLFICMLYFHKFSSTIKIWNHPGVYFIFKSILLQCSIQLSDPEEGGNKLLQIINYFSPDYMILYPRRQSSPQYILQRVQM